jgi:hypothetical protein
MGSIRIKKRRWEQVIKARKMQLEIVSDETSEAENKLLQVELKDKAPEKSIHQSIHQAGNEILSHMLNTIQRNLSDIPFFSDKEHDVHPIYKFVFQEIVKRGLAQAGDEEYDIDQATIGIEGFDRSRL